jgi:DNA primase large subunit
LITNKFVIKESEIPLDILFNKDINELKFEEHVKNDKPKPITFTIDNEDDSTRVSKTNVMFEIEGAGQVIQSSFVRKNEQTFFEFLNDFNAPNPHKVSETLRNAEAGKMINKNDIPVIQRRLTINKSQFDSSLKGSPLIKILDQVKEEDEVRASKLNASDSSSNSEVEEHNVQISNLKVFYSIYLIYRVTPTLL